MAFNPLIVVQLVTIIWPVVEDVIRASRQDSPGGKKITPAEWQAIVDKIAKRLLAKRVRDAVEKLDL